MVKERRAWFWADWPDERAVLSVRDECPYCGWWHFHGVHYPAGIPEPAESRFCPMCGSKCVPVAVDLGRMQVAAAVFDQ